jgi:hypothetical protein
LAGLLAQPLAAHAEAEDSEVIAKVTNMNRKAVDEYENLNFDQAKKLLNDALDLCAHNGLEKHPVAARTHIHLGVVLLAGFKQREQAMAQFRKALEIQPDIKVTKSLANPEVQEAFDQVAESISTTNKDGAGGVGGGTKETSDAIGHEPVREIAQGNPVPITVTVDASLSAKKVVVVYRPGDTGDFIEHELEEASPGNWAGKIPGVATGGDKVAYYIEAQNEAGDAIGSKGTEQDPFIITIRGTGARKLTPKQPKQPDTGTAHWFFGMAIGGGIGWATGNGEVSTMDKISPPGFALAQLGHVAPEVGYFVKENLLVSVQLRYQYVTGPTNAPVAQTDFTCGSDHVCSPAQYAFAAFARALYLFGEGSLHPYVGGAIGGGNIRHIATFESQKVCGSSYPGTQTCVDTIPSGPIFIGPSGGIFYDLTDHWTLTAGANSVLGFPKFTFNVDLNVGMAFEY